MIDIAFPTLWILINCTADNSARAVLTALLETGRYLLTISAIPLAVVTMGVVLDAIKTRKIHTRIVGLLARNSHGCILVTIYGGMLLTSWVPLYPALTPLSTCTGGHPTITLLCPQRSIRLYASSTRKRMTGYLLPFFIAMVSARQAIARAGFSASETHLHLIAWAAGLESVTTSGCVSPTLRALSRAHLAARR